jgi:hypothetical protein
MSPELLGVDSRSPAIWSDWEERIINNLEVYDLEGTMLTSVWSLGLRWQACKGGDEIKGHFLYFREENLNLGSGKRAGQGSDPLSFSKQNSVSRWLEKGRVRSEKGEK